MFGESRRVTPQILRVLMLSILLSVSETKISVVGSGSH